VTTKAKSRKTVWTNPKSDWPATNRDVVFTQKISDKLKRDLETFPTEREKDRIDAFDSSVQDSSLAKSID
jgi:hypothetical protein